MARQKNKPAGPILLADAPETQFSLCQRTHRRDNVVNKIEVYDAVFEDELKTRISHFFENVPEHSVHVQSSLSAQQPYPYWYVTLAETEKSPKLKQIRGLF